MTEEQIAGLGLGVYRVPWHLSRMFLPSSHVQASANLLPRIDELLKVALSRWNVEHALRRQAIGFDHFERWSWLGLLRDVIPCQVVMLFGAEQTNALGGQIPSWRWSRRPVR